jgi:hypothetical protein
MPKSKNRKNHKEKVIARNRRITEASNRVRNLMRKELEAKFKADQEALETAEVATEQVEATTSTTETETNG